MANEVQVKISASNTEALNGLQKTQKAVNDFKNSAESSFSSVASKFAGMLAAGAVVSAIKGLADEYGRIADNADKFGESTASVQRVGHAAEQAGTSFETVAKAMVKVNGNTKSAIQGNQELADAFAAMGINASEFIDLPMEEKLVALAKGYEEGGSNAERLDAVMKLLGKSGADLIPLLSAGANGLAEVLGEASVNSEKWVRKIASAGDTVEAVYSRLKVGLVETVGSVVDFFEKGYIKLFKYITLVQNLTSGITAATKAADDYEKFALKELESERQGKNGNKTNIEALQEESAERQQAIKAEQSAADDLAKLKAENDAKEEEARKKTLSLRERELELVKEIEQLQARQRAHKGYLSPEETESIRGRLLDLNKELSENNAAQVDEAEKSYAEIEKRREEEVKAAQKAAKDKAKAEKEAKEEVLKAKIDAEETSLDKLSKKNGSFNVDSLRQIGGGLKGVNYNAALKPRDSFAEAVAVAKQQLEVDKAILRQLEKGDKTDIGDGSFN